jgi:hypothetical protein
MTNETSIPSPTSAAFEHMSKASQLQTARGARSYHAFADTVRLAASGKIDPTTIEELAQLQRAALQRAWALGESWKAGWLAWWGYAGHAQGANTVSKLAEKQTNSLAQIAQLLSGQMTDLATFAENVEVNYAYWVSQKLAKS